jgi:cytochrome c oxidase cbb3-type subunit 2
MAKSRFISIILILLAGTASLVTGRQTSAGASATNENAPSPGKSIYASKCATCHGEDGKGDGIAASLLHPRPRDLTSGKFKIRSTESGSIPTDEDLLKTLRNGLHGTAMPDWKDFLGEDSLKAVVAYIKSFSPRFGSEQPSLIKLRAPIPTSTSSIGSGKKIYDKLQCSTCHGTDGTGRDAESTDLKDDDGNDISAANLTEPWTFRGGATSQDIYLRFRTGLDGTPMPSYVVSATDGEMWDLANYVVSLGRKPVWSMNEQELKDHYAGLQQGSKLKPAEIGKYLVESRGCGDCHSPFDEHNKLMESLRLAGGMRWTLGPYGEVTTNNLTSDKETGLGNWTDDEIKLAITRGIRKDGSRSIPFPMPWTSFASFTDDDLNAIVAYLRTLPPVYNKIPDPKPLGVFSYLWSKFKMLILKEDFPLVISPGNAGSAKEQSSSAPTAVRTEAHQ